MIFDLVPTLEAAEAERQADYARAFASLGGDGAVLEIGGGLGVRTDATLPVNKGLGLGVRQALEAAHLEALEAFLAPARVPAALDLCAVADGAALEVLRSRGYAASGFLTVLVRDLRGIEQTVRSRVAVRELGPDDLETWVDTSLAGWEGHPPGEAGRTLARLATMLPDSSRYGAFLEGRCVGVGGLQAKRGVATLYGGTTRPEARGRGVQAALLHARLEAAHALGCRWATSSATAGGTSSRNLERAGFAVAYTKVRFTRG